MRPARATKKSNPGSSKPTSTASQQGRRDAGSGVVSKYPLLVENTQEAQKSKQTHSREGAIGALMRASIRPLRSHYDKAMLFLLHLAIMNLLCKKLSW